ncbi:Oidioi.mRNA.OKI2018_I69.chr2.g4778.t1.cds [Oikopleura dioica]|uniref:Oidioi.mRNA.OKI2018_I69.chr2.g4778.t1.cds n=1 Tax=Oikopleura dioica TaxID=34765 RepID=A0ABN7T2P3_OIKDI|nr:Oidioi.mRNA.OKI2018_I69.chr2.g4778.t1.cds [Oikopleura dioica]
MGDKKLDQKRKLFLKSKLLDYAKKRAEELAKDKAEKKAAKIAERLPPLPDISTLDEDAIRQLCRELHAQTDKTDDNRYDLEIKNQKMNKEIDELRKRVQEVKERFKKPALKRVRISADQMLKTLLGGKGKAQQIDMRQNLKKK